MTVEFAPPGHGQWALDRSHYPNGATPISQWLLTEGMHEGFTQVFAELGLPAERIDLRFVNGFMYTRLRPLIGGDSKPRKPPPTPILKLASRLHPAFRKRNKAAIATLRDRPSNAVVKQWHDNLRPGLIDANERFQAFDLAAADDAQLQRHITSLLNQLHDNFVLHFWLHGHDLGPIARYLQACLKWGLGADEAIAALAGASPSTAVPAETLCRLRDIVESAANPIATLDELQRSSDAARQLLDDYLNERGHILATGYDLDARTLNEMPAVVLKSIQAATPPPAHNGSAFAGELRNRLGSSNRDTFDLYLNDARAVMDMRDDNGPLTIEWPVGLLRHALLAAGSRLADRSLLTAPEQLFEVTHVEARSLFSATLPRAAELAERAEQRSAHAALDAPRTLGPAEPEPPLSALPTALAQLTEMVQTATKYMGLDGEIKTEKLAGAGIGDQRYVGTARVASSPDEAFDRLEPGDVLIVRATSPAFNAVLAIAGAVITSDGGVLSHAAVLSRELGIPAVIGVPGALEIRDGSTVEVDAPAGVVRLVAPAANPALA